MASMATVEPILSPRVSSPWHTKRAPASSSTMAMFSGDRKPSGAACRVVNETISPTPATVVGVMATGCHGQYVAGGATTASHRGHREAAMSVTSYRLEDRDPVVGGEAADGVREGGAAGDLPSADAAR